MKIAMTLSMVALLATTGAASAGELMMLTDAELDRVTGGPIILQVPHSADVVAPSAVEGDIKVNTEVDRILIGLMRLPNGKELQLPAVQRK